MKQEGNEVSYFYRNKPGNFFFNSFILLEVSSSVNCLSNCLISKSFPFILIRLSLVPNAFLNAGSILETTIFRIDFYNVLLVGQSLLIDFSIAYFLV